MPKRIIVSPAFGSLGIVVSFESRIVLYNIMCCIYESVTKNTRSSIGHPGLLSLEITRLINGRVQSGKCKQFAWCIEAMDIANLTKYHSAIGSPNAWDGHDHRVEAGDKVCYFKLCME